MSKLLDANAILRYLIDDIKDQADFVEKEINNGAHTIPEVLSEVVYVLFGVYEYSRKNIVDTLKILLNEIEIVDRAVIIGALDIFSSSSLDYVDCIIAARAKILGEDILTFDKKLIKIISRES